MAESIPPVTEGALFFGRYRVRRELGCGGMGIVLLAHDEKLDQSVALKLVSDLVVNDAESIRDLRLEVLRGRDLTHTGIVRTYQFEHDDGMAAIVMEYVDGHTLSQLKALHPGHCFDPADLLPWLEQLCPALDYAHRDARIVHRDLKPANIMVTSAGQVKVADFGIASRLPDPESDRTESTGKGGTARYMSPQQAQGFAPSPLDDVYSLGATIYELLTSKPPFLGAHILPQVLQAIPPPMAARREELGIAGPAAISPTWEEAIAACLAKEPEDRPQSAGEFLNRLKTPSYVPLAANRRAWNWGIGIAVVVFVGITAWMGTGGPAVIGKRGAIPDPGTGARTTATKGATETLKPIQAVTAILAKQHFSLNRQTQVLRYDLSVPSMTSGDGVMEIYVEDMGDNEGDRGMFAELLDADGKRVFRQFRYQNEKFTHNVKSASKWTLILEDRNSSYNAGNVEVRVVFNIATSPDSTR